ncbi:DUF1361 domain-containing protein [Latilactobacillus curvatus]|uniref:DUF1361 domain-containing protein n=1 Tax=Latilactobacillus curvatus TaxID=28038 RepID=A0AAC9UQB3_LATCU|nr:DUF1361 domain-containing protein [Latilactobacillus curvatus]ASN60816.1 hypothetical protein CG419_09405 [Latilactobacillus curvatus]MDG2979262.1 DUF1361 domain-containing protein [Latilactobacillus curvatus]
MSKKVLTIHAIVLVFFALILLYQSRFSFLIWNLILALIPFDLSLVSRQFKHSRWRYLIAVLWLLFFPNALYMITDFSHLSSIGVGLSTAYQFVEYAILAGGVFIGVGLGLTSLFILYPLLIPNHQRLTHQAITFGILSVCSSIAIYLGRFLRINSWDVFYQLHTTIASVFGILNQANFWIFVIAFSILQLVLMLMGYQLAQMLAKESLDTKTG